MEIFIFASLNVSIPAKSLMQAGYSMSFIKSVYPFNILSPHVPQNISRAHFTYRSFWFFQFPK